MKFVIDFGVTVLILFVGLSANIANSPLYATTRPI